MFELLQRFRAELAELHPALPAIVLALVVGGLIYAWRRLHPRSFERVPKPVQALPAVLISVALAAASSGGDALKAVLDALAGVFVGLIPIGGHHVLKESPIPYVGGRWPAAGADMHGMEKALASIKRAPKSPPQMPIILILLGWLGVFTPSCAASQDPPGCSLADQKAISAQESAEALYACQGKGEDCNAAKDIHVKYRQAREDWFFRCQP